MGDDLFVTNTKILKEGIDKGIANSILIKINQIGTLTETLPPSRWPSAPATPPSSATARRDRRQHHRRHRRGYQRRADQDRFLSRSDRMAKYNQLLRIEEDLGDVASYPGRAAFYNLK